MEYKGLGVKFQHRAKTGKAILGKSFEINVTNPLNDEVVKQQFRHHTSVPTELRTVDALIVAAYFPKDGEEPHVTLLYDNGIAMSGSDWQSSVSVAFDVPHQSHPDAEGEQFWFSQSEKDAKTISDMSGGIRILREQLAEATSKKKKD